MILGIDISTSIIGISLLNDLGQLIEVSYIDLKKEEDLYDKLERFKQFYKNFSQKFGIQTSTESPNNFIRIFIEEPLLMFKSSASMAQTIRKITKN